MDEVETVALAASLLFKNGQTTEEMVIEVQRLARALGAPLRVLPHWDELVIEREHATPFSEIVPAMPTGVHMGKVLAAQRIMRQVCDGALSGAAARAALQAVERMPPVGIFRLALLAAIGAASLGVIFGVHDGPSLLLTGLSAGIGALARRWLARLGGNALAESLASAMVAGLIGAIASSLHLSDELLLVAFCPCMVLIPGPHILNGAIDLARTRITLGLARLAYAGLITLMLCTGLLIGAGAHREAFQAGALVHASLAADVLAAGCAVACFGTFFAMPWRLLPLPITVGMLAHAVHWFLVSTLGENMVTAAFLSCLLAGLIVAPLAHRLRLPFAAVGFSAVVSMMPGFFLFRAASALLDLMAIGPRASVELGLVPLAVGNGITAFLIILAMAVGLVLPRMAFLRLKTLPIGISAIRHGRGWCGN
jgi:uncharacterized membrane protein YjjP (DUF1212 family)